MAGADSSTRTRPRRWLAGAGVGACALLLAVVGPPASAAPAAVNGHFNVQIATGSACDAPAGVCLNGTVSGRIKGAFSFAADEIVPTEATPGTGVIVTTGRATVDTGEGAISCTLTGSLQISGDGPFVSICILTGGTGRWAGSTGYLRTSGNLVLGQGGSGSYDGKVTG